MPSENSKTDLKSMHAPMPFLIVASILGVFALAITVQLLFFSKPDDVVRQQTIYWFIVALIAASLPWIKEFKWKDIEVKLRDIENKIEWIANRRYTNLVYLIDDADNLALVYHKQYKRWIPCGSRLEPYEMPHEAVYRAVQEELGFKRDRYDFWPPHKDAKYGNTEIVPRPYQVQLEQGNHREGVAEHYDFVYVCRLFGERPSFSGMEEAQWIYWEKLEEEIEKALPEEYTFANVRVTYRKILDDLERARHKTSLPT
jgi:NUDIX domain